MAANNSLGKLIDALEFRFKKLASADGDVRASARSQAQRLGQAIGSVKWRLPLRRPRWRGFSLRRGLRKSIPWLLLVLVLIAIAALYLYREIVVLVKDGEAGVLYRTFQDGVDTEQIFGEGIHFIYPWDAMTIYNRRIQTTLHEFKVLTNKGLPISLSLAIRYYPEYEMIGVLHQTVGPDYVNTIVIPQIESVLRRDIGRRNPEDIYTNKEGILTSIVLRAIEEAGQKFVQIDDIIIRSVELPQDVKDAIDDKIVQQQLWQAYEFRLAAERQEAERKRIEARGVSDFNALIAESLQDDVLSYRGIEATKELAQSTNSKLVIIGGANGLPLILNTGDSTTPSNVPAIGEAAMTPAEPAAAASEAAASVSQPAATASEPAASASQPAATESQPATSISEPATGAGTTGSKAAGGGQGAGQ